MMKTRYSLLLAMMICVSANPLTAAETTPKESPQQQKTMQSIHTLEKRIFKLESNPNFSFEAQNRLIDKSRESYEARLDGFNNRITEQQASVSREASIFMWAIGAFIAFLTLLATLLGPKAIKGWIEDRAHKMTRERLDEVVTEEVLTGILQPKIDTITDQIILEIKQKAENEIKKIHELRRAYENLPKTLSESLDEQQEQAISKVDEVAEGKTEAERTAGDWFAIGSKADQEGRTEDCYLAFMEAMHLEENANSIGNVALAAQKAGHRDEAEAMYKRAIELAPNDADFLGNYANFLTGVRGKHDAAEEMYKRTIKADPKHAYNLANYAIFLMKQGRHDAAEEMHKRSIKADPHSANILGNYAHFLLAQGRLEGKNMLSKALDLPSDHRDLPVELNFYRFAHFPDESEDALSELKRLLLGGVRSKGWHLTANVKRAIEDGHPNPELLQALANVISKDAPLEELDKFSDWKAA